MLSIIWLLCKTNCLSFHHYHNFYIFSKPSISFVTALRKNKQLILKVWKQLPRDYMVSTKTPIEKTRCSLFLLWLLKIVLERPGMPDTGGGFPVLGPTQLFLLDTAGFGELIYLIFSFLLTILSAAKSIPLFQSGPSRDSYWHFELNSNTFNIVLEQENR